MGPLGREVTACRSFSHLSQYISDCLSLTVPGKGTPSMFPNRVHTDRDTPYQSHWLSKGILFIHSFMYVCRSPQKGALLHAYIQEKPSPSTEPNADRRPTYNGVRPVSPRGSLTTLLSLHQCHAALGTIPSTLAWVDQSPVSQRVS
jgi:hypothetical protein